MGKAAIYALLSNYQQKKNYIGVGIKREREETFTSDYVIQKLDEYTIKDDDYDPEDNDVHNEIISKYDEWVIRNVNISDIEFGNTSELSDEFDKVVKQYMLLDTPPPPPVILVPDYGKKYLIIDGFHRIAVAKKRGQIDVLAFIPTSTVPYRKLL